MHSKKPLSPRDTIIYEVDRHFVGPASKDEIIEDCPWDFYHTGMLWPRGEPISPDEDDQENSSGMSDDDAEGILNLANCSQQSAMGISAQLKKIDQNIQVEISWGEYVGFCSSHDERQLKQNWKKETEAHEANSWQRVDNSHSFSLQINTADANVNKMVFSKDGIELRCIIRETSDAIILTMALVNSKTFSKKTRYNQIIYQSEITLISQEETPFLGRVSSNDRVNDDEFWLYELLYRDARQYAVGHGCSVQWDDSQQDITRLKTIWLPRQLVSKASADLPVNFESDDHAPLFDNSDFLSLDFLSNQDAKTQIIYALRTLVSVYSNWIQSQELAIPGAVSEFAPEKDKAEEIANINLKACTEQCARINAGIDFLEDDRNLYAWRAFCLANETLALSMRQARPNREPSWRIFQLAFILISLPSTIDPEHPDRSILELIWFPTGGGKTEAYLGLAAMLLFYRRLAIKPATESIGTSIITRYTLRLLTIQQFERAASIICAANIVQNNYPEFSTHEKFSIGLFVGGTATPNTLKVAEEVLAGNHENEQCSTLPIQKCPWCQSDLLHEQQKIELDSDELCSPCSNTGCAFADGLPISVVDEQIYAHPPSIVIGTVDKFAMMPWVPEISNLLGNGNTSPDLIIQDELHLISDALGTVTSLYEGAIDHLTTRNGFPAKIIGSTATIRRAEEHVKRLFNRKLAQFPPSAISANDSFFYQVDKGQDRLYLGLHAQGRSPKHSLSRLVGNISQSNMYLDEADKDPFYSLVLYFNSLRELGGALVLLEDDVPRYLESLPLEQSATIRDLNQKVELTSQLNQQQLSEILDRLNIEADTKGNEEAVDVILSTNMISVGVDVGRLNLMVVNGQPKNTAEYIQASSRIGREEDSSGIVFTMYNWTRPRDRSHYERFKAFHLAFYRHVESTSVTPYAARARDRALPAILFSMARQSISELKGNHSVAAILDQGVRGKVELLAEQLVERAKHVDGTEEEDTKKHLAELIDFWCEFANNIVSNGKEHVYWHLPWEERKTLKKKNKDLEDYELLKRPDDYTEDGRIKTPTSMRDVEPPTNVQLIFKGP